MSNDVKFSMPGDQSALSIIFNKILFNQPLHDALYHYQNETGEIISEIRIRFNKKRGLKSCITAEGVDVILQSKTDFIGDGI